uniref:Uncharacterized protein n=1 Tax=Rhizobium rhizogenes TaxID=359 RepID=A0A7S4ZTG3_RHIRH|nr:hypothetical protein pC5.7b_386 [Rhizobium rhizogenes]
MSHRRQYRWRQGHRHRGRRTLQPSGDGCVHDGLLLLLWSFNITLSLLSGSALTPPELDRRFRPHHTSAEGHRA